MSELSSSERMRCFAAAALPNSLLESIGAQQDLLQAKVGGDSVRWTRPDQLHLTLRFYGNVLVADRADLEEALRRAARSVAPFQLSIQGLGCFPSPRRPSVIWLGLTGETEPLLKLQSLIENETGRFGAHSEDRAFHPHLTIGRVKAEGPRTRRIGEVIESTSVGEMGRWPVTEVELVQSQLSPKGSRYTTLARLPLTPE